MSWWVVATVAQIGQEFVSTFVAVEKTTVSRSSYKLRKGNIFANDYVQARDLYSSEFLQRERKCDFFNAQAWGGCHYWLQ